MAVVCIGEVEIGVAVNRIGKNAAGLGNGIALVGLGVPAGYNANYGARIAPYRAVFITAFIVSGLLGKRAAYGKWV